MGVIYRPTGRAGEYSHLAVNLYKGCYHGCTYCYGPAVTRKPNFHKVQSLREGVLKKLAKEAPKYAGTDERVLLCFACDPYQPIDSTVKATRAAIEILRANDIPFQILTKGGCRAIRDFDLYGPYDTFGTTLTFLEDEKSRRYEPRAPLPFDRIATIKFAKKKGIETWVSLEPVIETAASLEIIRQTHSFVDYFRIGKLNHAGLFFSHIGTGLSAADWREFGIKAIKLCRDFGVDYYIKKDLAKYMDGVWFNNTDRRKIKRKD